MRDQRQGDQLPPPRAPGLTPRGPSELMVPTRPPAPARPAKAKRIPIEREARKSSGLVRFVNGALSFLFVALLAGAAIAVFLRSSFDAPGPLAASAVVVIPKGDGIQEIAARLEKDGIVTDRRLFVAQYLAARFSGGPVSLKAGEYEIRKGASIRQVLDTLVEGKSILLRVTIPEGLTSLQIVERLRADPNLSGEITVIPPEGSLLPDTHRISRGMARQELIDRMQAEHQKAVAQLWARRQDGLPFKTPEQALVLASIVEKETGKSDEREKVAAVFVNRMRKSMRLQSDPTIIYGLVGGQGSLGRPITRADIDSRTPYNTYQIDGLPPGPICNPGLKAIEATLNPARTQDLFFVADGTGGHTFTTNLRDHNAAVANWRRIERETRERQRAAAQAQNGQAAKGGQDAQQPAAPVSAGPGAAAAAIGAETDAQPQAPVAAPAKAGAAEPAAKKQQQPKKQERSEKQEKQEKQ